jgi:DNA-binding transcriptional regulator YdaS (Cro superfamily)
VQDISRTASLDNAIEEIIRAISAEIIPLKGMLGLFTPNINSAIAVCKKVCTRYAKMIANANEMISKEKLIQVNALDVTYAQSTTVSCLKFSPLVSSVVSIALKPAKTPSNPEFIVDVTKLVTNVIDYWLL